MPNSSIWPIDRTLSDATTPGQSEPESNGKERALHISQSSRLEPRYPMVLCHIQDTRCGGVFLLLITIKLHLFLWVLFENVTFKASNEKILTVFLIFVTATLNNRTLIYAQEKFSFESRLTNWSVNRIVTLYGIAK